MADEQLMRTMADEIAGVILEHTGQDPEISVVGTAFRSGMVVSITAPSYRVDLINAEAGKETDQ